MHCQKPSCLIALISFIWVALSSGSASNTVLSSFRKSKNLATAFDNLSLSCLQKNLINYDSDNTYKILLNVSSFIASLTDGKALEWYKKMS